jgi:TPR repeat protein
MYRNGQGVPRDYKNAVKWFRLSAEQWYAMAQYNLGLMYQQGWGVPQDDKTAVKWFRLAAEQGCAIYD